MLDNESYFEKAEVALHRLFDAARARNELHFALSLGLEFRGAQDPGWNTAEDAQRAFDDYAVFIQGADPSPIKVRVALAFYMHLAEAGGYYEMPKNMLRVAGGDLYTTRPFAELVKKSKSGAIVAPNANRMAQSIAGHAHELGFADLAEVFRDAFDPDIRNGYAHADYILWEDGIRFRKRNGGQPRIVSYEEFAERLHRATGLFERLRRIGSECVQSYEPKRTITGRLHTEPLGYWDIGFDSSTGRYSISNPGFVPGAS